MPGYVDEEEANEGTGPLLDLIRAVGYPIRSDVWTDRSDTEKLLLDKAAKVRAVAHQRGRALRGPAYWKGKLDAAHAELRAAADDANTQGSELLRWRVSEDVGCISLDLSDGRSVDVFASGEIQVYVPVDDADTEDEQSWSGWKFTIPVELPEHSDLVEVPVERLG